MEEVFDFFIVRLKPDDFSPSSLNDFISLDTDVTLAGENYDMVRGEYKTEKIQNCLAWISDNLKTVWQGESGDLKTVCWFFKYCLLNFLNCFCVANCLI